MHSMLLVKLFYANVNFSKKLFQVTSVFGKISNGTSGCGKRNSVVFVLLCKK